MLHIILFLIPSKINKIYSAICISKFDWKFCVKKGKNIYITYKDPKKISWHFCSLLLIILKIQVSSSSFSVLPPTFVQQPPYCPKELTSGSQLKSSKQNKN